MPPPSLATQHSNKSSVALVDTLHVSQHHRIVMCRASYKQCLSWHLGKRYQADGSKGEGTLHTGLSLSGCSPCIVGVKSGASHQASAGQEVTRHVDRDRQATSRREQEVRLLNLLGVVWPQPEAGMH